MDVAVTKPRSQGQSGDGMDDVFGPKINAVGDLLWLLKRAYHHGLHTLNEAMSDHGVATAQLGLMRLLADEPGLSGVDLARRLLVTPQGVQLAITALERRGYVERKTDAQDGRVLRAYLTKAGRRVANATLEEATAAYEELFEVLDGDEQETFRRLLIKFLAGTTDEYAYDDPKSLS